MHFFDTYSLISTCFLLLTGAAGGAVGVGGDVVRRAVAGAAGGPGAAGDKKIHQIPKGFLTSQTTSPLRCVTILLG